MTAVQERIAQAPAARVDVPGLERLLLGRFADQRAFARALALDPRLASRRDLPMARHRAKVLEQLKILAAEGRVNRAFPASVGGDDDPGGSVAAFEEFLVTDVSTVIKSGVQWGLFCSAILHLGTDRHHAELLPDAVALKVPGVYAMTETGHGSDVASIGTTATYDPASQEFVIETPFKGAWKDYLGNAALHGVAAVVFAQLITQGVNHGVHAFYVPIRDESGALLPGVRAEDDGLKGGLNGIDNGRLAFTGVRVPRHALLNRYGDVAADGTYSSPIASSGRRFFTMLSTLVQGRVSLTGSSTLASKLALIIAIRYANQRRQFPGPSGIEETVLLDYAEHQHRLLPLLAKTYACAFASEELLGLFHDVFSDPDPSDADRQELETLAATLKPTATWHALETLQTAREACGGAGFLAENRITGLRADLDVFATFEGDNTVLLQLVAKRLLADYSAEFARMDAAVAAKYAAGRVGDFALHRLPLLRFAQTLADSGSPRRSAGQLRDPETQRELLADRVETMVAELAAALRPATKAPKDRAAALFNEHQHEMIEAAKAYADLVLWQAFTAALPKMPDDGTRRVMTWLRDLYALTAIEQNLGWHLMNGRLSANRARTLSSYVRRLLTRLRPHAGDLVDAFGYAPGAVRATIATDAEERRQREAADYYRRLRATSSAPIPEKRARS